MIPLVVGAVLAVGALAYVLYPIFFGKHVPRPIEPRPAAVDATIDDEIEAAVRAYREAARVNGREKANDRCAACGTPVVARDARYCSSCGNRLA